jgi:hypothetical protein
MAKKNGNQGGSKKKRAVSPKVKTQSVIAIVAGKGHPEFDNGISDEQLLKILECEHCGKGLQIEFLAEYKPTGLVLLHGQTHEDELLTKHNLKSTIASGDDNTVRLVDMATDDPVSTARVQAYVEDLRKVPDQWPLSNENGEAVTIDHFEAFASVLLAHAVDAPADVNQYAESMQSSVLKDERERYPRPAA